MCFHVPFIVDSSQSGLNIAEQAQAEGSQGKTRGDVVCLLWDSCASDVRTVFISNACTCVDVCQHMYVSSL